MNPDITLELIEEGRRQILAGKLARIGGRSFSRVERLEEFAVSRGLLVSSGAESVASDADGEGDMASSLSQVLERAERAEADVSLARERIGEIEADWADKTEKLAQAMERLALLESGNQGAPLLPPDFRARLIAIKGVGPNLADQVIALLHEIGIRGDAAQEPPAPPAADPAPEDAAPPAQ